MAWFRQGGELFSSRGFPGPTSKLLRWILFWLLYCQSCSFLRFSAGIANQMTTCSVTRLWMHLFCSNSFFTIMVATGFSFLAIPRYSQPLLPTAFNSKSIDRWSEQWPFQFDALRFIWKLPDVCCHYGCKLLPNFFS